MMMGVSRIFRLLPARSAIPSLAALACCLGFAAQLMVRTVQAVDDDAVGVSDGVTSNNAASYGGSFNLPTNFDFETSVPSYESSRDRASGAGFVVASPYENDANSDGRTSSQTSREDYGELQLDDYYAEDLENLDDKDDNSKQSRSLDAVPAVTPLIARADLVHHQAAVPTDFVGSVAFFQRFLAVPMYVALSFVLPDNTISADTFRVEIRTGGAIDTTANGVNRCINVGSRYTNPLRHTNASLLTTTLRVNRGVASALLYNIPGPVASLFGKYNIRNRIVAILDSSGTFHACGNILLV